MIPALTSPDHALAPQSDGKKINGNKVDVRQAPGKHRGVFEQTFKAPGGASGTDRKVAKKDRLPDQASDAVILVAPALAHVAPAPAHMGDELAKNNNAGRRAGGAARGAILSSRMGNGAQVADIAGQKAAGMLENQKQMPSNAVGVDARTSPHKTKIFVVEPPSKTALLDSGVGQNTKKAAPAKSGIEKLGTKKKVGIKQRGPGDTHVVADPSQAIKNDLVSSLADGKMDQDKPLLDGMLGASSDAKLAASATFGSVSRADPSQLVARAVAVQVSQATVDGAGRMVEITLDPVELGKVKLKLHPTDAGITVQIIADRADTIDLMRRNSTILEAEFRDAGYDNIDFAFSHNSHDGHAQANDNSAPTEWVGDGHAETTALSASSPISSARSMAMLGSNQGLDIRL